jgi:hypothetical protein
MHFHRSRVQAESLDPDTHNLFQLQFLKHSIQRTALGPAIHARVDGMPVPKTLGQPTPLASMLRHVQYGIQKLLVRKTYIATLHWQAVFDSCVLLFRDLHLLLLY